MKMLMTSKFSRVSSLPCSALASFPIYDIFSIGLLVATIIILYSIFELRREKYMYMSKMKNKNLAGKISNTVSLNKNEEKI